MSEGLPSPEVLRQILRYDPDTGKLWWLPRDRSWFPSERAFNIFRARFAGKEALCCVDKQGYLHGRIFGAAARAHRVGWAIHYGEWPSEEIDHENHVRSDNRLDNLSDVGRGKNGKNCSRSDRSISPHIGVYWREDRKRWRAIIKSDGVQMQIGSFKDLNAAIAARKAAEARFGFHENHGRRKGA